MTVFVRAGRGVGASARGEEGDPPPRSTLGGLLWTGFRRCAAPLSPWECTLPKPPLSEEQSNIPAFILTGHAATTVRERGIDTAWIAAALVTPDLIEPDSLDPGLIHALKRIDAREGRVLRVVYNPGASPVRIVTAFFDRSMKGRL